MISLQQKPHLLSQALDSTIPRRITIRLISTGLVQQSRESIRGASLVPYLVTSIIRRSPSLDIISTFLIKRDSIRTFR